MRALTLAAVLACAPGAAAAEDWVATLSGGASQADGDNSPLVGSASVSLERRFEQTWFGGALGASNGETNVPEIDAAIDQESVFGAMWWGVALGSYDLTLGADYADERLDGSLTISAVDIAADGKTQSLGVSASVARTFGEARALTPSLTLSYAETATDLTLTSAGGGVATISETASGFTLAARLDGAAAMGERANLLGGLAFIATDDASAQGSVGAGGQTRQRQEEGAAQWGEAYAGVEINVSDAAFLSGAIGSTIGREQEEAFGSVSLGWRF